MGLTGVITFKGNPMTLNGDDLAVKADAPDFTVLYADGGIQPLTKADLAGKPTLISVVPSLDTPVCATQTKHFHEALASIGDAINAVTISRDLPFAQARFCGAENVSMRTGSDYKDHGFGKAFGVEIDELGLLTRAVFVLDADGKVAYKEVVAEVTDEPDYDAALAAIRMLLS
ncbi:MAG: thiol peroxidase [Planctomycetota bacterium]